MNGLERIKCTLEGKIPDRVPMFDFLFQRDIFTEMIGLTPGDYDLCQVIDCCKALNLDMAAGMVGASDDFEFRIDDNGKYYDEWGTAYVRSASSWPIDAPVEFPVKEEEDFRKFKFPDPLAKGRLSNLRKGLACADGSIAIMAGIEGPMARLWMLLGPEELMVQMCTEPDFIKDMLKEVTDYLIELAKNTLKEGPDIFSISEDLGSSSGSLISPAMYKEFLLPVHERLMDAIDIPVFFHSCGYIANLLDYVAGLGIAAIHPLQRTANMDIKYVKERYGERVTIVGNIDSSRTLPLGTPDDVEREVVETMNIAKPGGRYILASDHSLHDGIPVENIKRLFKTGLEIGAY